MGEPPPLHETVCALCLGSVLWVLEWSSRACPPCSLNMVSEGPQMRRLSCSLNVQAEELSL